jgi:hypothetical protein
MLWNPCQSVCKYMLAADLAGLEQVMCVLHVLCWHHLTPARGGFDLQ